MTSSAQPSPRHWLTQLSLILVLGLLPLLTGCVVAVAGAAGAGAMAYVSGELESTVDQDFSKTFAATQAGLKNLEFARISEEKTAIDAKFIYRTALDKKVTVKLNRVTDKTTKISIRVGLVGDKPLSISILEKIKANL